MKIRFYGDCKEVWCGVEVLTKELGIEFSDSGIPVKLQKRPGSLEITFSNNEGVIAYQENIHFFRGLGLLVEALRAGEAEVSISEVPQFSMNGVMFDVSRNAVLKVESIKLFLRKMALMGLNTVLLYMEDVYEVKGMPYFGYMRGRYSCEELRECDQYANTLGIEMIPCIQTLSHLPQVMQWPFAAEIMENHNTLLPGSEKTYEFIEDIIKAAAAPFKTKKIHIGMDEAFGLGLGRYLQVNGYRNAFDIMMEHLNRVSEITSRYGLEPMMWSDMFFRIGSKTHDYYDRASAIPQYVIDKMPKDMRLVYWDYYHEDKDFYREFLVKHKEISSKPVFAGGIWTFTGLSPDYEKTFAATNAALSACKSEGISEVFATMWLDNGGETNLFSGLLGLQLFAEHGYSNEIDMEKLKKRFEFCTGAEYEAFFNLSKLDRITGIEGDTSSNPSKYILWQDILSGLFDKNLKGYNLKGYYAKLKDLMDGYVQNGGQWKWIFDIYVKLCNVLSLKSELGITLKKLYDNKDNDGLKEIMDSNLPQLLQEVKELKDTYREQWLRTYKAFGWDIIDMRFGGLMARIDTAIVRLQDYLDGKIDRIEELEEERLYFDGPVRPEGIVLGNCNLYNRIASAGVSGANW